jgi:hypothetical protein
VAPSLTRRVALSTFVALPPGSSGATLPNLNFSIPAPLLAPIWAAAAAARVGVTETGGSDGPRPHGGEGAVDWGSVFAECLCASEDAEVAAVWSLQDPAAAAAASIHSTAAAASMAWDVSDSSTASHEAVVEAEPPKLRALFADLQVRGPGGRRSRL